MQSPNILFARQPIYDTGLNVAAYELLFRPSQREYREWDGDAATSQLVLNAFTEIGIEKAADNKRAFINFTRNWLLAPPVLDPRIVIVEILESVEPDRDVVNAARALSEQGFTIALDDFVFDAKWHELLQIADIVKIDVLHHEGEQLESLVRELHQYRVTLLAEKVETLDVFEHCKSLGFQYFQGYFLCRPQNVHGETITSNKVAVMHLLAGLQKPDLAVEGLEKIIANDLPLSAKLLQICNSEHFAAGVRIDGMRQAMAVIGLRELKKWSSIIVLSRISDKPSELISLALTRGRMMELLAKVSGSHNADTYFAVGMFSLIDAFFDQSKQAVLQTIHCNDEVNRALLRYEGSAGALLQAVQAHEQGLWREIDWQAVEALSISQAAFEEAYLKALQWTADVMHSLLQ